MVHSTLSESVSQAYKPFYFEEIVIPGASFRKAVYFCAGSFIISASIVN